MYVIVRSSFPDFTFSVLVNLTAFLGVPGTFFKLSNEDISVSLLKGQLSYTPFAPKLPFIHSAMKLPFCGLLVSLWHKQLTTLRAT